MDVYVYSSSTGADHVGDSSHAGRTACGEAFYGNVQVEEVSISDLLERTDLCLECRKMVAAWNSDSEREETRG